jgi:hypothetical protein
MLKSAVIAALAAQTNAFKVADATKTCESIMKKPLESETGTSKAYT